MERFDAFESGSTTGELHALAQEAQEYAHNPSVYAGDERYQEPDEGAAVVARDGDEYVAVPGVLVDNGNYTNHRSAVEVAILNALTNGYTDIEQLAVSRDAPRSSPLRSTTMAVTETYLADDTPVTVEEDGDMATYRHDSLLRRQPQELAPELAADAHYDVQQMQDMPRIANDAYENVLVALSRSSMRNAYNPASQYDVGAALVDTDGRIYPGNNIEPDKPDSDVNEIEKRATAHGEETAILNWRTFSEAEPAALAVASRNSGNCCGYCKQWMAEFFEPDVPILNVGDDTVAEYTYGEIDPYPFRLNPDQ